MPDAAALQSTPLAIGPDQWMTVRRILQKHVAQYDVWAFGSRAKGRAKKYSDLDLAVITRQPLPLDVSARLSEDFSDSDLPWKVDVVDWATTSDTFKSIIERDYVLLLAASQGPAPHGHTR
jgi:type I restriction enzyme S subunit